MCYIPESVASRRPQCIAGNNSRLKPTGHVSTVADQQLHGAVNTATRWIVHTVAYSSARLRERHPRNSAYTPASLYSEPLAERDMIETFDPGE